MSNVTVLSDENRKILSVLKVVPLFIQLMTPYGAIIMVLSSNDCHNEVIITSLQGVIKRPLDDNTCNSTVY